MKKIMLGICLVFASAISMAQSKSMVAKIEHSKDAFVQTETTSTTKFELSATHEQMMALQHKAAEIITMKFTATAKSNNVYECVLVTTEQNHIEYVHKMFLTLGIERISFDGKESSLDELPKILKELK